MSKKSSKSTLLDKMIYPSSDSSDELLAGYHTFVYNGTGYDSSSDDGLTMTPHADPPQELSAPQKFRIVRHPDGFVEKRPYNTNGSPIIRKHTLISEEQAKLFSEKYNTYFYGLTGKKINFIITPTAQPYISMLEMCRRRDQILMTLFDKPPIVWDLMGGSGADSYGFLLDLDVHSLVIVERGTGTKDEISREAKALEHNIKAFCECFKEFADAFKPSHPGAKDARVQVHHMNAKDFIEQANPSKEPMAIDMAFLDPSWDKAYDTDELPAGAHADGEYEISPSELFGYLDRHIWQPLRKNRITVDIFVIKTRWEWSRVQQELEKINSEYIALYSIQCVQFAQYLNMKNVGKYGEIKGQYHYMILKHKKYQVKLDNRSKWYFDLIRRGKRIYVDERTIVKPFKPRYADHLAHPTVYYSPHEHCFEVTPPDFGKVKPPKGAARPGPMPKSMPAVVHPPRSKSPEEEIIPETKPQELSSSSASPESESDEEDDGTVPNGGYYSMLPRKANASRI